MPPRYDPAMLLQLAQKPRPKHGRPLMFATPEEKRAADIERHRIAKLRADLLARGEPLPDDLKPKRPRRYATEEERAAAIKQRHREYYLSHREEKILSVTVSYVRRKLQQ